jgi:multisubunit Na+/H+ antiporter MnhE subunit
MRVEFELEQADYEAFSEAVWRSRVGSGLGARRWALLCVLTSVVVLLCVLLTLLHRGLGWLDDPILRALLWAIAVVLALLVVIAALLAVLRRVVVGGRPRDPGVLGWKTIELTDDGVVETTSSAVELTPWTGVREVGETPAQIHLFVGRGAAHVVPKRAFGSPADAARFVEHARSKHARAHALVPAPPSASGWSKPAP